MLIVSYDRWKRYRIMANAEDAAAEKKLGLDNDLKGTTYVRTSAGRGRGKVKSQRKVY